MSSTNPTPLSDAFPSSTEESASVHAIPLDCIVPNPHQPRRLFEEPKLQELTDSIRVHGVLSPILVRQITPEQYELIAGERRWRAAQRAGLTAIPAIIRTFTEQEQTEIALIENLQRDDLSLVEMARAFRTLMNNYSLSQREVADRIHKSEAFISRIVRLLQLPDNILDGLESGMLVERHTRALLQVKNRDLREDICQRVLTEGLSAEATEQLVAALFPERRQRDARLTDVPASSEENLTVEDCETFVAERFERAIGQKLIERLETPVTIRHMEVRGGCIEIVFDTNADLLRISELLLQIAA